MKQSNTGAWCPCLAATLMLSGCGGPIHPSQAAAAPSTDALATVREQALPIPAAYRSASGRNPFRPAVAAAPAEVGALQPDGKRGKAPLESFPIDQLRLVGTLAGRGATSALVRDPQGRIHALRVGDTLGLDHGRVAAVHAGGVDVVETVRDADAGWTQRPRRIAYAPAVDRRRTTDTAEASHGS